MRRVLKAAALIAAICALGLPAVAQESAPSDELLKASQLGRVGSGANGAGGGVLDSIQFSGSVDVAYTYNWNDSAGNPENPVRVFDVRHNEFTMHNAMLYIEREANEDQMFGFGITPTIGNDSALTGGGGFNFAGSDIDVLQAYGAVYLGGFHIEVGKFFTNVGAESIDSGGNPNFSRSFLFGFGQPFTHTGVRATKGVLEKEDGSDLLTLSAGISNGWDSARKTNGPQGNAEGFAGLLMGELAPAEFFELKANWIFGNIDRNAVGDSSDTSHLLDLVSTIRIPGVKGLEFIGNFDWYGDENGGNYADYWGLAGIIQYKMENPVAEDAGDFIFAFRGEYVDDADNFLGVGLGAPGATDLYDLTFTLGYQPSDFFLVRGEVRYDKASRNVFENGARSQQTTMAVNTVFMF